MEFTSNAVSKNVIFLINQRLLDIAKQEFDAVLSVSSKFYFYQYIVTNVCLQEYLCKPIPELYKKCITKIRLFFLFFFYLLYLYVYFCAITIYCICIVSWSDELFIIYA